MPRRKLENRTIEVILLEGDKHLGERFEIVRVKPIFAKNVLLPKNKAVLATANMKNKYQQKIAAAEKDRANKAQGFEDLFTKITNDDGITLTVKTNKEGTLYAKIHEEEIAKIIKEKYGIEVDAHLFKLKNKIAAVGTYTIPFLYKEIKKNFVLNVNAEEEIKEVKKEVKEDAKETEEKVEEEKTEE